MVCKADIDAKLYLHGTETEYFIWSVLINRPERQCPLKQHFASVPPSHFQPVLEACKHIIWRSEDLEHTSTLSK